MLQTQLNQSVDSFSNQMGAKMGTVASMHTRALIAAVLSQPRRRPMPSPKLRPRMPRVLHQDPKTRRKLKVSQKSKDRKTKRTAKSGDVDFDENAQAEQMNQRNRMLIRRKIQKLITLKLLLLKRVRKTPMAYLTGLLVSARTTKTASWRPLHVHVQTLQ